MHSLAKTLFYLASGTLGATLLFAFREVDPVRVEAAPSADEASEEREQLNERIQRFLSVLGTLRSGDLDARVPLLTVANELCNLHNRCDTLDVARFYTSLDSEELQRGYAYELRYRQLYSDVHNARRRGLLEEEWLAERKRILSDLAALAAESAADADHAPAGRALSFSALLRADSLENRARINELSYQHELRAGHDEVERALEIFKDAGLKTPELEAHWVQGRLYRLSNRHEKASAAFERCLAQASLVGNETYIERALIELLHMARDLGDTRVREELLEQLSMLRRPEDCWPLVREYADWMYQADRAAEAQAILLRYPPPGGVDPVLWHIYLGGSSLRAGDLELAEQQVRWLEENEDSTRSMLARAQWQLALNRPEEVVRDLGDGTLEIDYSPRAESIGRSVLGEAFGRLGDWHSASEQLGRALGLAELYRNQLSASDHNVFGEWIGLHSVALAAEAELHRGRPLEAARIMEHFQSRGLRDARASRSGKPAPPLSSDSLLGWADAYPLGLVSWVVGPDFGVVAHVAPSSNSLEPAWAARIDHGRSELRSAARRLKEAILDGREPALQSLSHQIAQSLFPEPLRKRLATLAASTSSPRLLLLVHGPIESLPLALICEEAGALGIAITPVVMTGLPDAQRDNSAPNFQRLADWTLVAGADDASLPTLPATRAEIDELGALIPGARILDGSVDTLELERALQSNHPLHVAAHMTWGCECRETRLAPLSLRLGPGQTICSHQVAELQPASPLVVLSACESAAGRFRDAEGLQGLTRAFLESGTRNLLVTIWPVGDWAAKAFTLDFHRALQQGDAPSVAAQAARRAAISRGAPAADWAAFRLMGID